MWHGVRCTLKAGANAIRLLRLRTAMRQVTIVCASLYHVLTHRGWRAVVHNSAENLTAPGMKVRTPPYPAPPPPLPTTPPGAMVRVEPHMQRAAHTCAPPQDGVAKSDALVLFLTKDVLTRPFVQLEVSKALKLHKPSILIDPRGGRAPQRKVRR